VNSAGSVQDLICLVISARREKRVRTEDTEDTEGEKVFRRFFSVNSAGSVRTSG